MHAQTVKGLLFATTLHIRKIQKGLRAIMTVTDWKRFDQCTFAWTDRRLSLRRAVAGVTAGEPE